jgi:hypothetical protein
MKSQIIHGHCPLKSVLCISHHFMRFGGGNKKICFNYHQLICSSFDLTCAVKYALESYSKNTSTKFQYTVTVIHGAQ